VASTTLSRKTHTHAATITITQKKGVVPRLLSRACAEHTKEGVVPRLLTRACADRTKEGCGSAAWSCACAAHNHKFEAEDEEGMSLTFAQRTIISAKRRPRRATHVSRACTSACNQACQKKWSNLRIEAVPPISNLEWRYGLAFHG
jgi:hypothetical protein